MNMTLGERLNEFIRNNDEEVFIEAEGQTQRLNGFFQEYNSKYSPPIDGSTEGIIVLRNDANKWGLELRLYLHRAPDFIATTHSRSYRKEYAYRINNNDVIRELFELGYRIGLN